MRIRNASESRDFRDCPFFWRSGLERLELRRVAILFLGLLTEPPLRPFSRLARFDCQPLVSSQEAGLNLGYSERCELLTVN